LNGTGKKEACGTRYQRVAENKEDKTTQRHKGKEQAKDNKVQYSVLCVRLGAHWPKSKAKVKSQKPMSKANAKLVANRLLYGQVGKGQKTVRQEDKRTRGQAYDVRGDWDGEYHRPPSRYEPM